MPGHTLVLVRDIAASPERVWSVLTDLDSAADTLTQVTRIERLTPGAVGVGTRWAETRRMLGREETQELQVSAFDAPRRQQLTAHAGGVDYTTTFELVPVASGTRLTMRFSGVHEGASAGQRLVWRVLGPIGLAVTRRAMAADLADIAAAATGPDTRSP